MQVPLLIVALLAALRPAYGRVVKVRNKLDMRLYAIKQIPSGPC